MGNRTLLCLLEIFGIGVYAGLQLVMGYVCQMRHYGGEGEGERFAHKGRTGCGDAVLESFLFVGALRALLV